MSCPSSIGLCTSTFIEPVSSESDHDEDGEPEQSVGDDNGLAASGESVSNEDGKTEQGEGIT